LSATQLQTDAKTISAGGAQELKQLEEHIDSDPSARGRNYNISFSSSQFHLLINA